jgi:CrcB protein
MKIILCIGLGGFFGAIARYGLNAGVHIVIGDRVGGFPVGTLVINIIGCFVLGFLAHFFSERGLIAHELRLAITIGFLAAFTTFSTYALDTLCLAQNSKLFLAGVNFLVTNFFCLIAVWGGWRLGMLV